MGFIEVTDQEMLEQRIHERFRAKDGAFAVIKDQSKPTIGQIIDISKGGLAFKYLANGVVVKGNNKLDIFFSGQGIQLKDISFQTVCDFELKSPLSFSSIKMRRGCLQFMDLKENHEIQLTHFIKVYTFINMN